MTLGLASSTYSFGDEKEGRDAFDGLYWLPGVAARVEWDGGGSWTSYGAVLIHFLRFTPRCWARGAGGSKQRRRGMRQERKRKRECSQYASSVIYDLT